MKHEAKTVFEGRSIERNDDLSSFLTTDYVESLVGQGYRNSLRHQHGCVKQD